MTFVKRRTQEQQANVLAQYLPDNPLFDGKNKTNTEKTVLRKVLLGLANEWIALREKLNEIEYEYDPRQTTYLVEEWEKVVGIPDGCIGNSGTLETRRTNILLKLAGINATTAQQFENIADILGYDVTVEAAKESSATSFPMTFPFILMPSEEALFSIIVTINDDTSGFPLTFPFFLSDGIASILKCLFNKLKPANTNIYFRSSSTP